VANGVTGSATVVLSNGESIAINVTYSDDNNLHLLHNNNNNSRQTTLNVVVVAVDAVAVEVVTVNLKHNRYPTPVLEPETLSLLA